MLQSQVEFHQEKIHTLEQAVQLRPLYPVDIVPELTVHTDVSDGSVTIATTMQGTDTEVVPFVVDDIVVVGVIGVVTHAAVDPIKLVAGDKVTMSSFGETAFNLVWTVTGTPTKTSFTIDVTESSRVSPGENTYTGTGSTTTAVVSGGYCASYAAQATVCPEVTSLDTSPLYKFQ